MGLLDRFRRDRITENDAAFAKAFMLDDLNSSRPQIDVRTIMGRLPKSYEHAGQVYQSHPIVSACVWKAADQAADVRIRYVRAGDGGKESASRRPAKTKFVDQLTYISPWSNPRQHFFETHAYLSLDGNAYWYFEGGTDYIWSLRPDRVSVQTDGRGLPKGYQYEVNNQQITYSASDVLHIKTFNPLNDHYGLGRVITAALGIEADFFERSWNRDFFRNSAIPYVVLLLKQTLGDKEYKRLKREWEFKYRGQGKAHKTALLQGEGADLKVLTQPHKDMEFIEGQKMHTEEFLTTFGTPPSVMGQPTANYATARQQTENFMLGTILPAVEWVLSQFNAWDRTRDEGVFAEVDMLGTPALAQVMLNKLKEHAKLVDSGVITRNESRQSIGLAPKKGADELYIPMNIKPIGEKPPAPPEPENEPGPGEQPADVEEAARLLAKAIAGNTGTVDKDDGESPVPSGDKDKRYELRRIKEKAFVDKTKGLQEKWRKQFLPEYVRQRDTALKKLPKDIGGKELRSEIHSKIFEFVTAHPELDITGPAVRTFIVEQAIGSLSQKARDDLDRLVNTIFDLDAEKEIFSENAVDPITGMVDEYGKDAFAEVGASGSFDVADPNVIKFIEGKAQKFATEINETTWTELRTTLADAISEGEGMDKITERVRHTFSKLDTDKAGRAQTIARTEVVGACNAGQQQGYEQTGVVKKKEWVCSFSDSRPNHEAMDGEKVALDAIFSNDCFYPGDPGGPAEEVINCQCTEAPIVE